jgi:hydroxyethylthiazole kinase-like uncharacterized protein yjeF
MKYAYSTDSIRAAEAEVMAVVGDDALMQRAARGLAVVCARRLRQTRGGVVGARILVVAGPGNNGGDGLFAGAWLARHGASVQMWRVLDRVHEHGWQALRAAGGREVGASWVRDRPPAELDLVIDAAFGIGGREGVTGDLARLAEACRGVVDVVAVDLPSGLGAETVRPGVPVFEAGATVTFGAYKPCLFTQPACETAGEVTFVDLGLTPQQPLLAQWEALDVARVWPFPGSADDKYARGVVGLDAGSVQYPGAGLLALGGAVRAGAGMVRFLGPGSLTTTVLAQYPNVVHGPGRCQAYLCGPGWGDRADGQSQLASILATGTPTVIDADALGMLPEHLGPDVLLTPHAGELARLLDVERAAIEADPVGAVRTLADRAGATVLLKGATQYAASPGDACVHLAVPGPAWTAQAGSGDTLAGICATLLAAGLDARTAAIAAASVQAITARSHPGPHPPQEIARRLPDTIAKFEILAQEAL